MRLESTRLFFRILRNDLRLYFRAWQKQRRGLALTLLIQAIIIAFLHVQMPLIFGQVAQTGGASGGAGLACCFVMLFTLMAGFHRSVEVLYNRGDLPYLLSSPVPARLVILTRLADILATTSLTTLFIILPMLNCAVYLYGPHWLWGWAAWITSVAVLATLSLLLTILLVKWIGSRGARTVVQVLGIVVGTAAIAATQAPNWLRQLRHNPEHADTVRRYFAAFEAPPLPQLVAAASGDVAWLAVLALAGVACVWLALRVLEREFVSGAQSAAADSGGATRTAAADPAALARVWARAFRARRWSAMMHKELRTLLRDPLLLARSSTQLISFLPAVVGIFWLPRLAGIGIVSIVAPTMTAITTASLMSATDESLEIVCASPVSRWRAMWARALAAALPSAAIGWIGGAVLIGLGAPALGLATALIATFLAVAHAWLGGCTTPRQTADDRAANRPVRSTWQVFVSMLASSLGAGAIASHAMGAPVFVSLLLGLITVVGGGMMFLARPRPIWAE